MLITTVEEPLLMGISTKGESPVARDCVVELVGLEPTTRVLWNVVRVRPTALVGHPLSWRSDRKEEEFGKEEAAPSASKCSTHHPPEKDGLRPRHGYVR
jgi:hypothetical protein